MAYNRLFSSKRTNSTWDNSDILGLRGGDTKLRDTVFKEKNILFFINSSNTQINL